MDPAAHQREINDASLPPDGSFNVVTTLVLLGKCNCGKCPSRERLLWSSLFGEGGGIFFMLISFYESKVFGCFSGVAAGAHTISVIGLFDNIIIFYIRLYIVFEKKKIYHADNSDYTIESVLRCTY